MAIPETTRNPINPLDYPSPQVPIVDFKNWTTENTLEERLSVAEELVHACRTVGFVSIINHGISRGLLDEAFAFSKRLFDLKLEEKLLAPHPDGSAVHRGYSWPGLEKVSDVISTDQELGKKLREIKDCKESYEIGSEENADMPNVWLPEDILPGYRKFMTNFYWQCNKVSYEILAAIGMALGLRDPDFLLKFHSGHFNQLRLLHYPPIPAAELENQTSVRMPAHTDWASITMLFQDDCGGLEVENRQAPGQFIKVEPLKNAIVMNIGDMMMRWSNDILKSTLHRVSLPPSQDRITGPERMTRSRYSIPYFVGADFDSLIECLPECANEANPAKYGPILQRDYILMRARMHYLDKAPAAPTASG